MFETSPITYHNTKITTKKKLHKKIIIKIFINLFKIDLRNN
jgi:hypothetical protein